MPPSLVQLPPSISGMGKPFFLCISAPRLAMLGDSGLLQSTRHFCLRISQC